MDLGVDEEVLFEHDEQDEPVLVNQHPGVRPGWLNDPTHDDDDDDDEADSPDDCVSDDDVGVDVLICECGCTFGNHSAQLLYDQIGTAPTASLGDRVVLWCEHDDVKLYAHTVVLSAVSPVIKAFCQGEHRARDGVFVLKETSSLTARGVLYFVYTQHIPDEANDLKVLIHHMQLAHALQIDAFEHVVKKAIELFKHKHTLTESDWHHVCSVLYQYDYKEAIKLLFTPYAAAESKPSSSSQASGGSSQRRDRHVRDQRQHH